MRIYILISFWDQMFPFRLWCDRHCIIFATLIATNKFETSNKTNLHTNRGLKLVMRLCSRAKLIDVIHRHSKFTDVLKRANHLHYHFILLFMSECCQRYSHGHLSNYKLGLLGRIFRIILTNWVSFQFLN